MFIDINGTKYHVDVKGAGQPLLLLHGFTGDSSTWTSFLPKWGQNYKVISIDIIGHGKTDSPERIEKYHISEVTDQINKILDELKIPSVHLLGYSMGGRLAIAYYMKYPQTVKKLILESSSPGLRTEEERRERRIQDEALGNYILKHGMECFINKWESIPLFKSQQRLDESIKKKIRNQRLANHVIGLSNSLKGMGTGAQPSYWLEISKIAKKTLLITGELDQKFVQIAKNMTKMNELLTHISVKDAGHAIHVEKPEIFGTIVMEFLADQL